MPNVNMQEPDVDAATPGATRLARNNALIPGHMDSAVTAAEAIRGAIQYIPGAASTADQFLVTLKSGTDSYVNRDLYLAAANRRTTQTGASVLTLTEAMSGSLIECGAAEDFILPTIVAGNIGIWYEFIVTVTATSLTVTAAAAQLLHGGVRIMSTGAGVENDAFAADGTDDLIMTMNGTTQGGIIGSTFKFTARSTTKWLVTGELTGSGTIISPFT